MSAAMPELLIQSLPEIAGQRHVHTGARATRRFRKGYRYGDGEVLAAVAPANLMEKWRVLQACVDADIAGLFGRLPGRIKPMHG
jgi:D-lactate dehydrogenase